MRHRFRFGGIGGLLLLGHATLSFGRKSLDTTAALRSILLGQNRVESAYLGNGDMPSRPWYAFGLLLYRSTRDDFVALSNSQRPADRTWGYIGLLARADPRHWYTLQRVRLDTAMVDYVSGCDFIEEPVRAVIGEFYFKQVLRLQQMLATDPAFRRQLYKAVLNPRLPIPDFNRR